MAFSTTEIYIFGDQTRPVFRDLGNLILVGGNPILTTFLNESFFSIQREISSLRTTEKNELPQVESFGLLVEAAQKSEPHGALDSACLCAYEVGSYIQLLARKQQQHTSTAPRLVGLCTGSFAAAAVSCSHTLLDVARIGVQAVTVAFRIGMHVHRRARMLGQLKPGCWSLVVSPMQEEAAKQGLADFCTAQGRPPSSMPYISAVGSNSVTISGPPTVLDILKSFPPFTGKRLWPAPVHGPYHAAHLYSELDLAHVVETSLERIAFVDRKVHIPVLSCANEFVGNNTTFSGLLRQFITGILTEQLRVDQALESLPESLTASNSEATLIPVNTQISSDLKTLLTHRGITVHIDQTAEALPARDIETSKCQDSGPGISDKIAITGFSGRFPEADNLSEFWDVLRRGLDVHKPIPENRFDREAHYDPTGQRKNTSQILNGCWVKDPSLFDPQFFHMSPREACQTDPAQRLAILTAYEALEMAGFVADRTPSTKRNRVGVYYGTTSNDWGEVNSAQDIDTYFIPGANRAFIPGRINYFFKFTGPSLAIDTACSSSMAAIDIACKSILNGDCATAVAGGTNIMTNPDNFAGLDRGYFLSRTGNCKTFDNSADGYCRADGIGTVILKRYSDALADGDPVFGVILGSLTNHSAESISITRPLADAQEFLFRKLLNKVGVRPHDISYIEMHGTGTQAGDAVEMRSVLNVFAWDHSRPLEKTLHLGSVKANMGHGESASGVTSLIKVLLMMQENKIPPHCGIKSEINKGFPTDLDRRGVRIAQRETDWPRPGTRDGKRRVFVNNFSAAGGNSALLLEDAPFAAGRSDGGRDARTTHLVTVSARSAKSLKENLVNLAHFIDNSTSRELLAQISYTTTARRAHHSRRVAIVTSDALHLRDSLLEAAAGNDGAKAVPAKPPGVGFLFTGQGAQETAMGYGLYRHFSSFRADINDFDSIARLQGLPSILPLVSGTVPIDELSPTVIQLGTCIIQMAMARLWINLGLRPQYVLGHSLGEYAAMHVSGIISISDAIFLCGQRAALLEQKCTPNTHGMLVVFSTESDLKQVISGSRIEIACLNGPADTVLSGPNAELDTLCGKLNDLGYKFHRLSLPFAFHSSMVNPILDEFEELARQVDYRVPDIPFVSPLLGSVVTHSGVIGPQYLRRQCRKPVNFLGAVNAAEQEKLIERTGVCIEIGTHPLLTRMVKSIVGKDIRCCPSLRRGEDCFVTLPESLRILHLAGLPISWDEYHKDFPSCHKVVNLPAYSWDYGKYWMQYTGSWSLTKGGPATNSNTVQIRKTIRLSDSVHEIIEQDLAEKQSSVVVESDLRDPALLQVAEDHRVNGLTLCPSTLYADIAYTLSKFLLDSRYGTTHDYMPDIGNMAVEKALIVREEGPQPIRAAMTIDWNARCGSMELYSIDNSGKRSTLHATCSIELQSPQDWKKEWKRQFYLIDRSIMRLVRNTETGSETTHRVHRGMAYKLFSSTVKYGPAYQGMQDIFFDSEGLEATAKTHLPSEQVKGQFAMNPFICDSLGHLSGFIMNANDTLDLTEHVYVNHGWRYMRASEPFTTNVNYQTYVKMQPVGEDGSKYSGDVYTLRDGSIVAVCGEVTFNRVPRKVLEMLLPSPRKQSNRVNVAPSKPTMSTMTTIPTEPIKAIPSTTPLTTAIVQEPSGGASAIQQVLQIICDEVGIDAGQFTEDTDFADLGVDSLMSLTILGVLRESLDMDVPASLFQDCPTVKSLRDYLFPGDTSPGSTENESDSASSGESAESAQSTITIPETNDQPPATSMILQGSPKNCRKALFLFPDGSGSATSYTGLPPISSDLCVYGLNCPYLKNAKDLKGSLEDLTPLYLTEVRRRQPTGPYYLAGWSAGGISAFDAAQQLVDEGEIVEHLILLDSPNPIGIGKLPPAFNRFLEESGVFGAAQPAWLYAHFVAFVEVLDNYSPTPFRATRWGGGVPRTTVVWATDGVCKNPGDPRPPQKLLDESKEAAWLLENRTNLGPNGWDYMLGEENITIRCVEGANHFTLVREPNASRLVEIIREAIAA